ncbi:hypothetical protein E4U43_000991 [Claviceps pusilla]|uniref:Uncharacterized protein n=1 Tax=Claviceps pusilla TaxID=123648 RepID=A0A9P7N9R0_9HYPO|nr:hypothetical protein E4U43_000991 [Claviceps pusilla]
MVQLGNWLILSLNVARAHAHAHAQDGTDIITALQRRNAEGAAPSYASDLGRLHHTVRRARSVIKSRDTSIPVLQSEVESVLAKLQDLERQVQAMMQEQALGAQGEAVSPNQRDCDAENLMYDLGARAAVDANGQVSGHPFFRRNANCTMESAAKGNTQSNTGAAFPSNTTSLSPGTDSTGPPSGSAPGIGEAANSNSVAGAQKPQDGPASDSGSAAASAPKPAPDSAPPSQRKKVVMGGRNGTVSASSQASPAIYTRASIEVHTISDNLVTTTLTRTRKHRLTVHVSASSNHSFTGAVPAASATSQNAMPTPLPSIFVTSTRQKTSNGLPGPDGQAANSKDASRPLEKGSGAPRLDTFRKFASNTNTTDKSLASIVQTPSHSSSLSPTTATLTRQIESATNSLTGHDYPNLTGNATDLPLSTSFPGDGTSSALSSDLPDARSKFAAPKIKFLTMQIIPIPSSTPDDSTSAIVTTTTSYSMPVSANASAYLSPRGFKTVRRRRF